MEPASAIGNELLLLCLARDCERNLPRFVELLRGLHTGGVRCTAIVGENGSRDRTRALLKAASQDGVEVLDTAAMAAAPCRLARMALGRQLLLDAACQRPARPDFVGVVDLDEVMQEPPSVAAVLAAMHRLRHDGELFGVGATSHPVYYDLLALRAPGYDFASLNAEITRAKRNPLTYYSFQRKRMFLAQNALTSSLPQVCESTFNGFCLYNADDYFRGTYRASDEAEVCEHVTMNRSIGKVTGKHMHIFQELSVRTPHDHAPVGPVRFWYDRLLKTLA